MPKFQPPLVACRILCVLIALLNIFTMSFFIIKLKILIIYTHDESDLLEKFIPPCAANIVLAVILIIGIITREMKLVWLFKMFFFAQLAFALLMVVFGFRLFVQEESQAKRIFTYLFVGCGIELIIVSATLEAMRQKAAQLQGTVHYVPQPQTAQV
ncbi:uncharacterized protein LOC131282128 [Anopheles ziemanni]|uniref:uncharacterized protein LOC131282128 n=1 Tax=Anopheles ziemanni TaxID=345580 RepID=UPI00265FFB74|nr:uncharacterized protein LOC131282128 [Anopheles ziemanni]